MKLIYSQSVITHMEFIQMFNEFLFLYKLPLLWTNLSSSYTNTTHPLNLLINKNPYYPYRVCISSVYVLESFLIGWMHSR